MHKLESIAEQIRKTFDARTSARDQALAQARQLTRACSLAIRAVHRSETDTMKVCLDEARQLADTRCVKGICRSKCDLRFDSKRTASDSRGPAC